MPLFRDDTYVFATLNAIAFGRFVPGDMIDFSSFSKRDRKDFRDGPFLVLSCVKTPPDPNRVIDHVDVTFLSVSGRILALGADEDAHINYEKFMRVK